VGPGFELKYISKILRKPLAVDISLFTVNYEYAFWADNDGVGRPTDHIPITFGMDGLVKDRVGRIYPFFGTS
jgi:hypothetical protein